MPVFPDVAVSNTFKGLCNNYLEGGGGGGWREMKIRQWVGIGENDKMTTRERGVGCKT